MDDDNAIIWRNGALIESDDLRLRFRSLEACGTIYDANGLPNAADGGQNNPDRQAGRQHPRRQARYRGDGLNGGTKNVTATTSATVVSDLDLAQVVRLSLASWAQRLSGLTGMTMSHSVDVLASGSRNGALVLDTNLVNKEYSWVVVPF